MLKQDALNFYHSKVRRYTILNSKKVDFSHSMLPSKEELQLHADEPCLSDADGEQQSKVLAENYGQQYPSFTVFHMKEDQFWSFVIGGQWDECSSLRVTKGRLMDCLSETYDCLIKQGLVFQYATTVYDTSLLKKKSSALKKPFPPPDCVTSASEIHFDLSSTSNSTLNNKVFDTKNQELLKITFTYYGTSVNHLSAALLLDGIKEKSFDKTLHNVDSNQDFWNKLPSLSNLCSHYSKESIGGRLQLISEADPRDDKLFVDILGRERQIFKRKFTKENVDWNGGIAEELLLNDFSSKAFTLSKYKTREKFLQKRQCFREGFGRKRLLHKLILDALDGTKDPYERWWLCLKSNKDQDLPRWNVTPDSSFNALEDNKTKPVVVKDPNLIDLWKCDCDVCAGALLFLNDKHHSSRGPIAGVFAQKRGEDKRSPMGSKDSNRNKSKNSKNNAEERKENKTSKKKGLKPTGVQSPVKSSLLSKTANSAQVKANIPQTKSKKRIKSVKDLDQSVWWASVSTFHTPFWKIEKNKPEIAETKFEADVGISNSSLVPDEWKSFERKLKQSYSNDRLKKMKKEKTPVKKISKRGHRGKAESKTVVDEDKCDTKPDDDNLYSHVPGVNLYYTKLPTIIPMPCSDHDDNQITDENTCHARRSQIDSCIHTENTNQSLDHFPLLKKSKLPTDIMSSQAKCQQYITDNTITGNSGLSFGREETKSTNENVKEKVFFESVIPSGFRAMSAAALKLFIVRQEKVVMMNKKKTMFSSEETAICVKCKKGFRNDNSLCHVGAYFCESDRTTHPVFESCTINRIPRRPSQPDHF